MMKLFLSFLLLFVILSSLKAELPAVCENIPIRLLADQLDYQFLDFVPEAKQMGRFCIQKNYLDTQLICPENVPDIFESEGIEKYLTRGEREFLVEFKIANEYLVKFTDYGKKHPLNIHTNNLNYLERESWSTRKTNFMFFLFNQDLTLKHFEFLTQKFIKLIPSNKLEIDCQKINKKYYQKSEVDHCKEEIIAQDFSALKKWRGIFKEIFHDDIKPFHIVERLEGIHNSVGIAYEFQYKTPSGKVVPKKMHTHYTSNPYYLYKFLTRPPCPGWKIHRANLNYHNGSSAYAFFRSKNGKEYSTPNIDTDEFSVYEDSMERLFTRESKLTFHSCRSVLGFDNENADKRIGNFLYQHTAAKITGYENTSIPLRPLSNPWDFGKSKSLQNLEFTTCMPENKE